MRYKAALAGLLGLLLICGCQKDSTTSETSTVQNPAGGVAAAGTPDVGAVTPVTHTSLDDAAGGGVNSAAMKKAQKVAGEGVGSVNSNEKAGYGGGDDSGN